MDTLRIKSVEGEDDADIFEEFEVIEGGGKGGNKLFLLGEII